MRKLLLAAAAMLTMTTSAFAQLGNVNADLVFTPITPCRIVDTRTAGGVIPSATSRVFKGAAANYNAQGGSATNCGLPTTASIAALAVNLLVIVPTGEGWIAAWPVGTTMPLVSNLNYKANDVLANSAILKINTTTADFNLYTTTTTHFVADVTGYYSRPVAAGSLECIDVPGPPVSVAANASDFELFAPACTAGYTSVGINYTAGGGIIRKDGLRSNLFVRNTSANAEFATPYAACCRIPGR